MDQSTSQHQLVPMAFPAVLEEDPVDAPRASESAPPAHQASAPLAGEEMLAVGSAVAGTAAPSSSATPARPPAPSTPIGIVGEATAQPEPQADQSLFERVAEHVFYLIDLDKSGWITEKETKSAGPLDIL